MSTPRRRQASTVSIWPQLSLVAIYADEPVLDAGERATSLTDEALEAAKVLYFAAPVSEHPCDAARQNRTMGTVLGVSSFARTLSPDGAARICSVQSNKRRMLWLEAEPGLHLHATVQCARWSRHPRKTSSATDSSEASREEAPVTLAEDEVLLASLRQAYSEFRLRFGSIQGALDAEGKEGTIAKLRKFWDVWTQEWEPSGATSRFESLLDAVPKSAVLSTDAAAQLGPLLAQFAASNPSALSILLHGDTVLSLPVPPTEAVERPPPVAGRPPPPPLSRNDLIALVRYLDRLIPTRRTLLVTSDVENASSASTAGNDSGGSGRWSSFTASMSSLLAPRPFSLAMPLPGIAPSSDSTPASGKPAALRSGFAALRKTERQEVAKRRENAPSPANDTASATTASPATSPSVPSAKGNRWSLRNVSWGALGFGASEDGLHDDAAIPEADGATPSSSGAQGARGDPSLTTDGTTATALTPATGCSLPSTDDFSRPATPAVELAPSVDANELADAIGRTPTKEEEQPVAGLDLAHDGHEANDGRGEQGEQDTEECRTEPEERLKAVRLFCGEAASRDTLFEARLFERGALRLALAILPSTDDAALAWLDGRAERLLEAVESLLEVVVPPKPLYPHRHFVKHNLLVTKVSPAEPAASTTADADSECALVDNYIALHAHPRALESVTRLSSTRWSLHRRFSVPFAPDVATGSATVEETDVFAILPSRGANGKDLSLIDAADELRRIEQVYLRRA